MNFDIKSGKNVIRHFAIKPYDNLWGLSFNTNNKYTSPFVKTKEIAFCALQGAKKNHKEGLLEIKTP
ncbi:hypothetical protein AXG55_08005 [Silvanigrella aquatica]|uniref:Uncharacterized protein n=1 Tax=Silvanigrella aquatica TaxID=1915309 RepID=A0A1L4D0X8_9BACT|nr:hypothetical protein AXG55_08005 [Silvanigrella aquatica]